MLYNKHMKNINKKQQLSINNLAKRYNLSMIVVFGSKATDNESANSDLDIAIFSKEEINFDKHVHLINDFKEIFPLEEIDLSIMKGAEPLHAYQIAETGILLYGEDEDFLKYRIKARNKLIDAKSLFKLQQELLKKKIYDTSR